MYVSLLRHIMSFGSCEHLGSCTDCCTGILWSLTNKQAMVVVWSHTFMETSLRGPLLNFSSYIKMLSWSHVFFSFAWFPIIGTSIDNFCLQFFNMYDTSAIVGLTGQILCTFTNIMLSFVVEEGIGWYWYLFIWHDSQQNKYLRKT